MIKKNDGELVIVNSKNENKENEEFVENEEGYLNEKIIITSSKESTKLVTDSSEIDGYEFTKTKDNLSKDTHGEELVISSASDDKIDPILTMEKEIEIVGVCDELS